MTQLTTIEYAMQLNRAGVTLLASGQLVSAKETFRDALAAVTDNTADQDSGCEAQEMDNTEEDCSKAPKPMIETVPVKMSRMDDVSSCSEVNSSYRRRREDRNKELTTHFSTGSTRMNFYNRAFLVSDLNKSEYAMNCYTAVLLFNMALAFQQEVPVPVLPRAVHRERSFIQQQKQARSSTTKAIKLYNMAIDLIAEAPQTHTMCWKLLIAAIFNKGCALCDLSQWHLAREVVADLALVLSSTTSRPPDFEEDDIYELHLQSLMDGSLVKHASAA